MSQLPHNNRADNEVWYSQPNPDEYSYNPGYGFFQQPPGAAESEALRRYAMGIASALLGYVVLSLLLPTLFASLLKLPESGGATAARPLYFVLSGLAMALSLGLPFMLYGRAIRIPTPVALPTKRRPQAGFIVPAVFVGLGLSVIGRFFMLMMAVLLGSLGLMAEVTEPLLPDSPTAFVLWAIGLTVLPAIMEEFALRGVVMQSLRRFGDGFALIISSLLFMLLHQNLLQYPNALLMGLFIGYSVLYTGSIWTGVILHLANNTAVLGLMLTEGALGLPPQVTLLYYGALLLGALVALAFLIKRCPSMFGIAPSRAFNPFGALCRMFYSAPMVLPALIILLLGALRSVQVIL